MDGLLPALAVVEEAVEDETAAAFKFLDGGTEVVEGGLLLVVVAVVGNVCLLAAIVVFLQSLARPRGSTGTNRVPPTALMNCCERGVEAGEPAVDDGFLCCGVAGVGDSICRHVMF